MAYINQIAEDEATGRLEKVYSAGRARHGAVANIIKVMSQDAASTEVSMQLYVSIMKRRNVLPAPQREMLATVVSNINACYY